MVFPPQPIHLLPQSAIVISHILERNILLPHGRNALIERRHGFKRHPDELADRPVQVIEKALTLSGKEEESCQEEGKQSQRQTPSTVGRPHVDHRHVPGWSLTGRYSLET